MKKILAIIGSPNSDKSNTMTFAIDFMKSVKDLFPDVEIEAISIGTKNIGMCKGCWACTKVGKCIVKDDLEEIQTKMLESDLILLGSPVYVHQVSAQFKSLVDRLFIWIHMLALIGKPIITVTTTAGTGARPTEKYLRNVVEMLGGIPIGSIRAKAYQPNNFPKREFYLEKTKKIAKKVSLILDGKRKIKPVLMNKLFFWGIKMKIANNPTRLAYEHNYWKEKKWLNKSYSKILKEIHLTTGST